MSRTTGRIVSQIIPSLALAMLPWSCAALPAPKTVKQTILEAPLRFEANLGQTDARVKYIARGPGYTVLLAGQEAVLNLRGGAVRMRLVGSSPSPAFRGVETQPGLSHYLIGNDPSAWRTDVPAYRRVQFDEVYPGVDLVYYGNQRQLEYDFVVEPGADPARIRLQFDGIRGLSIDKAGDLVIDGPEGVIRQHAPIVYQKAAGGRERLAGRYVVTGKREVAFHVANYDRKRALVIDPVLSYSTYIGGTGDDGVFDIAVDSAGCVYAAGITASAAFPTTTGSLDTSFGPSQITNFLPDAFGDAFVTKFAADGKTLIYSTFLGGSSADGAEAIAVDANGQVAVVGATNSSNFPMKNAYRSTLLGWSVLPTDVTVTVLNAAGNALVYSTFFGTTNDTLFDASFEGAGIAFDSTGAVVIASQALETSDIPMRNAFQGSNHGGILDAFVAKFDPHLSGNASLIFSTYLGGSELDSATYVATDSSNNIYVRGGTCSSNFPVTAATAYQATAKGNCDAFLTKFTSAGALSYSTYLGGSGAEYSKLDADADTGPLALLGWQIYSSVFGGSFYGSGLAVDNAGNAYITGATRSTDFPATTGAYQNTNKGSLDAFVAKIDTTKTGTAGLIYATYLGGSNFDRARAVAVDASGVAYVLGETKSTNFPVTSDAAQAAHGGNWDFFVASVSADGKTLPYSTYFGGSAEEQGLYGIKLDGNGGLYIGGASKSANFPTTTGAYQTARRGGWDGVVSKFDVGPAGPEILAMTSAASGGAGGVAPGEIASIYGVGLGPEVGVINSGWDQGTGKLPTTLGGVQVTFDGQAAPLFFVMAGQINVQVPYEVAGKANTKVAVTYNGNAGQAASVAVVAAHPGVFVYNDRAIVTDNATGALITAASPIARNGNVVVWATGPGVVAPPVTTGAPVTTLSYATNPQAWIGGNPVEVQFAGMTPGMAGLMQINLHVPGDAPTGANVPLKISINGVEAKAFIGGAVTSNMTIAIQ